MELEAQPKAGLGMGVDPPPSIDPTANVLSLVEAAVHRLDDLRAAQKTRIDDLIAAEFRRIDQLATIRSEYSEKLSIAEAKRIDAIRAVDVNAVAVASERQAAQAIVLANQVAASADALRALVASTAATMAQATAALTTQFNERIGTLEKSSYEGKGRQAYSDPAMAELIAEMRKISTVQSQAGGKSEGLSTSWAILLGVAALAAALFGSGLLKGGAAPPVVYVQPAPAIAAPVK